MLAQLATLVHFRILMLRRVWFRTSAGQIAGVLGVIVALLLVLVGIGIAVGLFFAGRHLLVKGGSNMMLLFMDPILILMLMFWAAGVMTELQRSDVLDFRKMLYLPVSLRMVFLLNFTASLVTPILPLFVLGALGLTLGLVLGLGPRMLLVLPLAAAFFVMLAAWTYHFRGWLGVLMENKRRRRMILTLIPVAFVIIFQLPNILTNVIGLRSTRSHQPSYDTTNWSPQEVEQIERAGRDRERMRMESLVHKGVLANAVVPPGWLALGMKALHERDYPIALLCFAGMTALGGLGLAAGYRSTYRHYVAATKRRARVEPKPREKTPSSAREPLTGRSVPGLSDDTAAVVFASWLTAVRHPSVRMQIVMPFIFGVIFMLPMAMHRGDMNNPLQGQPMIGVILFMILASFAVFLFNLFGTDPEGFQALVLLPTPRRRYILGKNLAFLPIVGLLFALFAGLAAMLTRPEPTLMGLITLQFFQIYLSLCLVGNFLSILFPYRMRKDSMNASGGAPGRLLAGLASLFGLPLLMLPTGAAVLAHVGVRYLPGLERVPLGLIVSALFLATTAAVYWASLGPAGRLLQSREHRILTDLLKGRE